MFILRNQKQKRQSRVLFSNWKASEVKCNLDISVIQMSILSFFVVVFFFFKDLPGGRGGRGSTFRKPRREVSVAYIYLPPQGWAQQSDRSPGYVRAFIHLHRPWLTSCFVFCDFYQAGEPRTEKMLEDQDWTSVYTASASFRPGSVPLPVRMGYPVKGGVPPEKKGNLELIKVRNTKSARSAWSPFYGSDSRLRLPHVVLLSYIQSGLY